MKLFWTKLLYFLLFGFYIGINSLYAQWQQATGGMYGGYIRSIHVFNNKTFAGSYGGGVFVYDSATAGWHAVNNGFYGWGTDAIECLASNSNSLFCGTQGGLYVSMNNGLNWNPVNPLTNFGIRCLAVDANKIFVGIADKVYYSVDGGISFLSSNNLGGMYVTSLAIKGDKIFAGTFDGGIYRSGDGGATWTQVSSNSIINILSLHVMGNTLFAASYTTGIYSSVDEGNTWIACNQGLSNLNVRCLTSTDGYLFTGTTGGVYISANGGNSWSSLGNVTGLSDNAIFSLYSHGNRVYAGTLGEGIFYTDDYGGWWELLNNGLTNFSINAVSFKGDSIFCGPSYKGVYFSTDLGDTWSPISNGLTNKIVLSLNTDGQSIFTGTRDAGIFRSDNGGNSWIPKNNGINNLHITDIKRKSNKIYCGTYGAGVYESSDNGDNWSKLDNGLNGIITALSDVGTYIFAGTLNGIFRTEADSNAWSAFNTNLPSPAFVMEIGLRDSNVFISLSGSGMYKSVDYGNNWNFCSNGIPSYHIYAIAFHDNFIFAGVEGAGVYISDDNGDTWLPFNEGLENISIRSLGINGNYIYAGTSGHSFWRRPLEEIAMTSGITPVQSIRLFPNPAHDYMFIQGAAASQAFHYSITDPGGRIIQQGDLNASENQIINVQGLPKGIFFLQQLCKKETVRMKFVKI